MFITSFSIALCLALNSLELNLAKNYSDTEVYRIQKGQSSCPEFQVAQMEPNTYVCIATDLVKTSAPLAIRTTEVDCSSFP
jgi:hypothetical protein